MKSLLTINENDFEPTGYSIRKVVRSLILDQTGTKVLFFGSHLVGGGVEEGETDEQAVAREAMEEAGARVKIGKCLVFREYADLIGMIAVERHGVVIEGDLQGLQAAACEHIKQRCDYFYQPFVIRECFMQVYKMKPFSGNCRVPCNL